MTLATQGVVWIGVDSEKFERPVRVIESRSLSLYNSIKTLDFSNPLHNCYQLKTKRQIKRISPTVCHKKEWPTYIQIPCLRKGQIWFCKKKQKKHSASTKEFFWKLISSKCLSFWMTTYLLCLVGVFLKQTVGMIIRGTLHPWAYEEKRKEANPIL